MPANLENSAVATGLEKVSNIPIPKKGNAKESSNYHTIALISHASKVMLTILQARLQQYVNRELPDVQAGFRKGRGSTATMENSVEIPLKTGNRTAPAIPLLGIYTEETRIERDTCTAVFIAALFIIIARFHQQTNG